MMKRFAHNPPAKPDPLGAYGVLMDAAFEAGMLDGPPAIFLNAAFPQPARPLREVDHVTAYHRINAARASWYLEQVAPEKRNVWRKLATEVFEGRVDNLLLQHCDYNRRPEQWMAVLSGGMGRMIEPQENPPAKPKLTDCPVLRNKHWTEDAARVAMDWCLERGLIDDGLSWLTNDGSLAFLPQHIRAALIRDLQPHEFRIVVEWEEDAYADWSWLEQPEFADERREDHIAMCAHVRSAQDYDVEGGTEYWHWHDEPVSLCGIDFLRDSRARVGNIYADEIARGGDDPRPWVHSAVVRGGDPYQLEVSRELIDEFGALDPEPPRNLTAEYQQGRRQAFDDVTTTGRAYAEDYLREMAATPSFSRAFVQGYAAWLREHDLGWHEDDE